MGNNTSQPTWNTQNLPATQPTTEGSNINTQQTKAPETSSNDKEEGDDFTDFIDSETVVSQAQPPPKELTEEEKKQKEEEDRIKRQELISSAFDESLFEEDKPEAKKEESEKKEETQDQKPEEPKVENPPEEKQNTDSWANFEDGNAQNVQTPAWGTTNTGWDQPAQVSEKKDEPTKDKNDSFEDFEDAGAPQPNQNKPEEKEDVKMEDSTPNQDPFDDIVEPEPMKDNDLKMDRKASSGEAFPSLFNQNSTPRVEENPDSDIRMSFPSGEMWSSNFGNKSEEKAEEENKNSGWGAGNFEFKSSEVQSQEVIKESEQEEDPFQDIMDMKEGKQTDKKDDSFEEFEDPKPAENQDQEMEKEDEKAGDGFGDFKSGANNDGWGNFEFENKDTKKEEDTGKDNTDSGWATFTEPTTEVKEPDVKVDNKNDPFNDPFASAEKRDDKDNDSDFEDFADPVEDTPPLSSQNSDAYSKDNDTFKQVQIPDNSNELMGFGTSLEDKGPIKHKEFNEKEMFKGFMNTVNELTKSHLPAPTQKEEEKDKSTKLEKRASQDPENSIKQQLRTKVANFFGDFGALALDGVSDTKKISFTEESLQGKLEDKETLESAIKQLIKQENYSGAEKIWKHIDIIDKIGKVLEDKKKAAAQEQYEQAMKLRDEADKMKEDMLNEKEIMELLNSEDTHHHPTLKFLINQVLYRVDDCSAEYFVNKFLNKLESIEERDFESKLELKKDVMLEALVLLKISKIGIDEYKTNCDELVPFLVREIEENLLILNELKDQDQEVLDALKDEEKFLTFLKGIKALYQILINMQESAEILDLIDTKYAMDIEVFCQELKQGLKTMQKILSIIDKDLGISEKLIKPLSMKEKILGCEEATDEGFTSIQKDKYNNICSLCATYISNGQDKDNEHNELHLPERRLVFNNMKEEQQTYHNY